MNLCEFESSLVYIDSSRIAGAIYIYRERETLSQNSKINAFIVNAYRLPPPLFLSTNQGSKMIIYLAFTFQSILHVIKQCFDIYRRMCVGM